MDICKMDYDLRKAWVNLFGIKETELRIGIMEQAYNSIDKSIHIGGAFSALLPLTTLFYGGYIDIDVENPTNTDQDMFVLSKGHAVATLAQIYADLGYYNKKTLCNSRAYESILNGHPGPLLPGIHISTGPLGEGVCVAAGLAFAGKRKRGFDVFAMTGDGELQEGIAWESFMFAAQQKLSNFCVLIDNNNGQLDDVNALVMPFNDLKNQIESFGWNVYEVDATQMESVMSALGSFKYGIRNSMPTAILCKSTKGHGGFSSFTNQHKAQIDDEIYNNEITLQKKEYLEKIALFKKSMKKLSEKKKESIIEQANKLNLRILSNTDVTLEEIHSNVKTKKAAQREKKIIYGDDEMSRIVIDGSTPASEVFTETMKVLAKDERIVSIDSDLGSVSGLGKGVAYIDKTRALNVGIAEANMMNIGEAFAVLGYNVWVSTFCPFFNWQVMRRIAVGYQERLETIEKPDGWLSKGHGLDLTFVATASNLDTVTNGATHMGNDDIIFFSGIPNLKIIDASCPRQLFEIIKWICEGNRGLVYLRIMRAASPLIYDKNFEFEYAKGYILKEKGDMALVSSGRGVHECLAAEKILEEKGVSAAVIDMPSFDSELLINLLDSGKKLVIVEQNNGYILQRLLQELHYRKKQANACNIFSINTCDVSGKTRFIHSGTYDELVEALGLSSLVLANFCIKISKERDGKK